MDDLFRDLLKTIGGYNDLLNELQKKKRQFGRYELYASEIHTLVYIVEHSEMNFTQIAHGLNMTKGALTRLANKLLEKGLIEKYSVQGNNKSIYYRVTEEGQASYKDHSKFHERFTFDISEEFLEFMGDNKDVIKRFLQFTDETVNQVKNQLEVMSRE